MRILQTAFAAAAALALWQVDCGSDAELSPTSASGTTAASGAQGGSGGAGGNATASGGGGTAGAGGAACAPLGDMCTECAFSSSVCEAQYCGCLGTPACDAYFKCATACPNGDEKCHDACELESPGGYSQFLLLAGCLAEDCSPECGGLQPFSGCFQCWLGDCSTELDACVGDAGCNQFLDCVFACPMAGSGCVNDCYAQLSDTSKADALFMCTQANCQDPGECGGGGTCQPVGGACTQCAFDSPVCNGIYCDCLASPDCGGYAQCVNGCAMGDEPCHDGCELAYPDGYASFYQMVDCMGGECQADCGFGPLPGCFECLVNDCTAQLDACQGDMDCNEFLDCTSQCMNQACNIQCYATMSDTTEADALLACIQGPCSGSCGQGSGTGGAGGAGGQGGGLGVGGSGGN